jgi:hypothetical protein
MVGLVARVEEMSKRIENFSLKTSCEEAASDT